MNKYDVDKFLTGQSKCHKLIIISYDQKVFGSRFPCFKAYFL
jgi:hypothetical protein